MNESNSKVDNFYIISVMQIEHPAALQPGGTEKHTLGQYLTVRPG